MPKRPNRIVKRKKTYTRTSMSGKRVRVRPHKQSYYQRESVFGRLKFWQSREDVSRNLVLYVADFPTTPQKIENFYIPLVPEIAKNIKRPYNMVMKKLETEKESNKRPYMITLQRFAP